MEPSRAAEEVSSRRRSSRSVTIHNKEPLGSMPSRTITSQAQSEEMPPPRKRKAADERRVCSNCGTTETTSWRSLAGAVLCGACRSYYRDHNCMRPKRFWRSAPALNSPAGGERRDSETSPSMKSHEARAAASLNRPEMPTINTAAVEPVVVEALKMPADTVTIIHQPADHSYSPITKRAADKENIVPFGLSVFDRIKQNKRSATKKYTSQDLPSRPVLKGKQSTRKHTTSTMPPSSFHIAPADEPVKEIMGPTSPSPSTFVDSGFVVEEKFAKSLPPATVESTNPGVSIGFTPRVQPVPSPKRVAEVDDESQPPPKRSRSLSVQFQEEMENSTPPPATAAAAAPEIQHPTDVAARAGFSVFADQSTSNYTPAEQSTDVLSSEIQPFHSSSTLEASHRPSDARVSPSIPSIGPSAGETPQLGSQLLRSDDRKEEDERFIQECKESLLKQSKWKTENFAKLQARRILKLLDLAKSPNQDEALFLSGYEAKGQVQANQYFSGPIITQGQQPLALQTVRDYLNEQYDDDIKVSVQKPETKLGPNAQSVKEITIGELKEHFSQNKVVPRPWNCLELAAHVEDGLRPAFLDTEDCRLLTKLKHPSFEGQRDEASRRKYVPGWKEVEKWTLLAKAGALTTPHQDSHGYSTYITVNQGIIGFGWLANPTDEQRAAWRQNPAAFTAGEWRTVILRPGHTIFFPAGTVHFVFRHPNAGDTLAFGGHVLRCSQVVRWAKCLLEEKENTAITNEGLSFSAPGYLNRVEKFVRQALQTGQEWKWGGKEAIEEFLELKKEFLSDGRGRR